MGIEIDLDQRQNIKDGVKKDFSLHAQSSKR